MPSEFSTQQCDILKTAIHLTAPPFSPNPPSRPQRRPQRQLQTRPRPKRKKSKSKYPHLKSTNTHTHRLSSQIEKVTSTDSPLPRHEEEEEGSGDEGEMFAPSYYPPPVARGLVEEAGSGLVIHLPSTSELDNGSHVPSSSGSDREYKSHVPGSGFSAGVQPVTIAGPLSKNEIKFIEGLADLGEAEYCLNPDQMRNLRNC